MKTVKEQIKDFFSSQKIDVEFEDKYDGFMGTVLNMVLVDEKLDSVLIHWYDSDYVNRFSISVLLDTVRDSQQLRHVVNLYNVQSYGWKAVINCDDGGNPYPFVSFECEYEYVRPDKIFDILESAFDTFADDDNEDYFHEICSAQLNR